MGFVFCLFIAGDVVEAWDLIGCNTSGRQGERLATVSEMKTKNRTVG